jgi:hypothetical protein
MNQNVSELNTKDRGLNYKSRGYSFNKGLLYNLYGNSTFDFFFLRKLFYITSDPTMDMFSNDKDKLNVFNSLSKIDNYTKGNNIAQTSTYKSMLDELITDNRNTYFS